jgi:hypothetical protein
MRPKRPEDSKIKKVELLFVNQPSRRKVKVTMTSGNKVYIEPLYESWQQYGGVLPELKLTVGLADKYNDWLHGGPLP